MIPEPAGGGTKVVASRDGRRARDGLLPLADRNAEAIGAGHAFIVFLKDVFPINVMNAVKRVPEVCRIFCATSNPVQVVVAEAEQGRGILGVIDGVGPKGVEGPEDIA